LVSFQAYQFKYDSIHGRFNGLVEVEGDNLIIDGQVTYRLSKERRTVKHVNLILAWFCLGGKYTLEKKYPRPYVCVFVE
jgi:hypothetical protein